ncbi:AbrB/MazE/SpoVT family DNA-binding domain-containing protein [Sphingomonas sp. PB4P5]|jgi:putative addiction module antidote|uniref:AbrB/MazE/SpoVT family DNA-binding domain-containing protein n=1 Tax=Parasphingomonas puruogangriensis TaxID=3096155 RepID=UPI002FC8AE94
MNIATKLRRPLKIIKIGNSQGVILPKDMLDQMHVVLGDELHVRETAGGISLSPVDPDFVDAMTKAEEIMREDRDILAVLAK